MLKQIWHYIVTHGWVRQILSPLYMKQAPGDDLE